LEVCTGSRRRTIVVSEARSHARGGRSTGQHKKPRRKASRRRGAPGPADQRAHAPPDDRATEAKSPSHLVKRGFQGLVAVVGLLIALTQLVDWLERRGAPTLNAEFSALRLYDTQLRREFIRDLNRPPEPDEIDLLDQRGVGMKMRIRARADPERRLPVRWTVYDAATGRPVPGAQWSQIVAYLRARREETETTVPCFVPLPDQIDVFFVVLTVETEGGRVVAGKRTKRIPTGARD
jgi:hypothetical protein